MRIEEPLGDPQVPSGIGGEQQSERQAERDERQQEAA
jgi:hypothetical protein